MKTTVIYHSDDFDGIFCREIARKFMPEAELIGWNFGDNPISPITEGMIYVLDLPLDRPFGYDFSLIPMGGHLLELFATRFVWIDHHKTSIDSHPEEIPGYRIDGVAACRLAWQWFTAPKLADIGIWAIDTLPIKQHFLDRKVSEPLAVRLAGEYDIWDKRDPDVETFQYGLRSEELKPSHWSALLGDGTMLSETIIQGLLANGRIIQRYQREMDANLVRSKSYRLSWEGLDFIVLNTGRFNSLTFAELDVPETGHDALMGFTFNGSLWTVILYHARHRTDLNLSKIALKHGGGGHRGACGFTCQNLPFYGIPEETSSDRSHSVAQERRPSVR